MDCALRTCAAAAGGSGALPALLALALLPRLVVRLLLPRADSRLPAVARVSSAPSWLVSKESTRPSPVVSYPSTATAFGAGGAAAAVGAGGWTAAAPAKRDGAGSDRREAAEPTEERRDPVLRLLPPQRSRPAAHQRRQRGTRRRRGGGGQGCAAGREWAGGRAPAVHDQRAPTAVDQVQQLHPGAARHAELHQPGVVEVVQAARAAAAVSDLQRWGGRGRAAARGPADVDAEAGDRPGVLRQPEAGQVGLELRVVGGGGGALRAVGRHPPAGAGGLTVGLTAGLTAGLSAGSPAAPYLGGPSPYSSQDFYNSLSLCTITVPVTTP